MQIVSAQYEIKRAHFCDMQCHYFLQAGGQCATNKSPWLQTCSSRIDNKASPYISVLCVWYREHMHSTPQLLSKSLIWNIRSPLTSPSCGLCGHCSNDRVQLLHHIWSIRLIVEGSNIEWCRPCFMVKCSILVLLLLKVHTLAWTRHVDFIAVAP